MVETMKDIDNFREATLTIGNMSISLKSCDPNETMDYLSSRAVHLLLSFENEDMKNIWIKNCKEAQK